MIGQPQGVDQGVFQQVGIADGGQLGQQNAVAVPFLPERGDPDHAPGLAHARHPGDRDEPGILQQPAQLGQFALAARGPGQFGREGAGHRHGTGVGIIGIRAGVLQASHETRSVLA
ncbi:hypothetical protein SBADM41S_01372 [Streptomyces badius]